MTPEPAERQGGTGASTVRAVVVGAGIAGLQTALVLRRLAPGREVVLLSKGSLGESGTRYAQGGIAAVVPRPAGGAAAAEGAEDSVESHITDTLRAGAALADPHAVAVLCRGAAEGIAALERAGVAFDTAGTSGGPATPAGRGGSATSGGPTTAAAPAEPARGREAAHSAARILHIDGDATGAGLVDVLTAAVRADQGIRVLEDVLVTRVLLDGTPGRASRATGVEVLGDSGVEELAADAVVLATGGAGQLFAHTTNPVISTGDGVALAWRAGAVVADLEFFQFHPTSLDVPGNPLVSEAVRGEGARLVDAGGRAFMKDYHPDGDLAPRDVVARGIAHRLSRDPSGGATGDVAGKATDKVTGDATGKAAGKVTGDATGDVAGKATGPAPQVLLDATALGGAFLARRFPSLSALTARHGFDWSSDPVPVVPAAHYWMGGVRTDTEGRTSVPGLFAVGEVARTGVHGANRLASNSLLEGVVFGARCAQAIAAGGGAAPAFDAEPLDLAAEGPPTQSFTRQDLQALMSDHAGILRTGEGLDLARKHLASYRAAPDPENANLLLCARLLVRAAADRAGSCGAHFRSDQADTVSGRPAPSRSYVQAPEGTTP